MAKLDFELFEKEKKRKVLKQLSIYGIESFPHMLVRWGKRLRVFSGSIDRELIFTLFREINIDSIGLYFASQEDEIRMSTDAVHLLSNQIKKGILELNDDQAHKWFLGKDVELDEAQKREIEGFKGKYLILKNGGDLIGVGKKSIKGITNFMPKERRIKKSS